MKYIAGFYHSATNSFTEEVIEADSEEVAKQIVSANHESYNIKCVSIRPVKTMTLEEAIEHFKQESIKNCAEGNGTCGYEHSQLAEWLTELKARRAADVILNAKGSDIKAAILSRKDIKKK